MCTSELQMLRLLKLLSSVNNNDQFFFQQQQQQQQQQYSSVVAEAAAAAVVVVVVVVIGEYGHGPCYCSSRSSRSSCRHSCSNGCNSKRWRSQEPAMRVSPIADWPMQINARVGEQTCSRRLLRYMPTAPWQISFEVDQQISLLVVCCVTCTHTAPCAKE